MISAKNKIHPVKTSTDNQENTNLITIKEDYIKKLKKIKNLSRLCMTPYQKERKNSATIAINKLCSINTYDQMIAVINEFYRAFDNYLLIMDRHVKEFIDETSGLKGIQVKKQLQAGDYYLGEMKDGSYEGKGLADLRHSKGMVYKGDFENGIFHGYGSCEFYNHSLIKSCVSHFYHGRMLGQCEMRFNNGDEYKGSVVPVYDGVAGIPSGPGEYKFSDGTKLYGMFKMRFPSKETGFPAKGILEYPDSTVYQGQIVIIKKGGKQTAVEEGYGVRTYPDKSVYKGEFHEGLPHGYGTLNSSDKYEYKGYWTKGYYHSTSARPAYLCQMMHSLMIDPVVLKYNGRTWHVDKHALEEDIEKQKEKYNELNNSLEGFEPVFCLNMLPLSQMEVAVDEGLKKTIAHWMKYNTIPESDIINR